MDHETMTALRALAAELTAEKDQDYKDDWERGHDRGEQSAGRRLQKLLDSVQAAISEIRSA